jgi:two-component sensor histidine kinase
MDLNFPTIPVEKFGLAIEEALANAYRHGQATKVSVLLNPLDSQLLECTITDNGVGLSGYKRDGLGSALFEAIAPGNWSRELGADGVGTRLRLLVSAPNNPSVGDI